MTPEEQARQVIDNRCKIFHYAILGYLYDIQLGRLTMLPVEKRNQPLVWSLDRLAVEFAAPAERQYPKV